MSAFTETTKKNLLMRSLGFRSCVCGDDSCDPGAKCMSDSVSFRASAFRYWPNLNCCLQMDKALILDSRVEDGMRSLRAAPRGPKTRPLVSRNASSIIVRSSQGSDASMWLWIRCFSGPDNLPSWGLCDERSFPSIEKVSPRRQITDLSTTFCNSRTFPGHG
jgi:hypothetical protein